jgi:hypothetical protein
VHTRGGDRPRKLAAMRSILESLESTVGGYKGRPVMWDSKIDAARCPQALCRVGLAWNGLERRGDAGESLLGFGDQEVEFHRWARLYIGLLAPDRRRRGVDLVLIFSLLQT